jgi:hypothetical protein
LLFKTALHKSIRLIYKTVLFTITPFFKRSISKTVKTVK